MIVLESYSAQGLGFYKYSYTFDFIKPNQVQVSALSLIMCNEAHTTLTIEYLYCNSFHFKLCSPINSLWNPNNSHIEVMLQYYRKYPCRNKFKYDHTYSKWIDVDYVISIITMSYNSTNEVYTLDKNDSRGVHCILCLRTTCVHDPP
jgi:hypothetical protein